MINKTYITQLVEQHLNDGLIYLTSVKVSADNQIQIFVDGDEGVTIADCVSLSRFIEKTLNETNEDFSLDVSSHGATAPIELPRQYKRHIGREFEIKLNNGTKVNGLLTEFNNEQLILNYQERENKPLGKGKITVNKQHKINLNEIKESKIKLKF
ncbi:MAG: ribosome assembly cofactor RimP [Bacteroidetes bacterium]|nr:ribosome assembly cofactor RimP [Bacteroidota bacterium]